MASANDFLHCNCHGISLFIEVEIMYRSKPELFDKPFKFIQYYKAPGNIPYHIHYKKGNKILYEL